MSFVEKHKAWLLPLLALGAGGVVYLNLQTFSGGTKTPPPDASATPEATPADSGQTPPAPQPAPPATALSPATVESTGPDLWSDLKRHAIVPPPLDQEAQLQTLARSSLSLESTAPSGSVPRPGWYRDPLPKPKEEGGSVDSTPPPEVDFLVTTPEGTRAWFEGQGYRAGQSLNGKPFVVGSTTPTHVDLKGAGGRTRRWTNPLHRSGPAAPSSPETP